MRIKPFTLSSALLKGISAKNTQCTISQLPMACGPSFWRKTSANLSARRFFSDRNNDFRNKFNKQRYHKHHGATLFEKYDEIKKHYANPGKVRCNFADLVLSRLGDQSQPALLWHDSKTNKVEEISYADLLHASNQIAERLSTENINKGDAIGLIGQHPIYYAGLLACNLYGYIAVPIPELLSTEDMHLRQKDAELKAILCPNHVADKLSTMADVKLMSDHKIQWHATSKPTVLKNKNTDHSNDTPLIYLYTSGTTSHSKAAVHNQDYPFHHIATGLLWMGADGDDTILNASDPGWGFTVWSTFGAWAAASKVLVTNPGKFNADEFIKLLNDQGVTVLCAAPTVLRRLVSSKQFEKTKFPKLRHIITVGEQLDDTVLNKLSKKEIQVRPGYGQAESAPTAARIEVDHVNGSIGDILFEDNYYVLLDENDQPVKDPVKQGQLSYKMPFPGLFRGYLNDKKRTDLAFTADGQYYKTGDIVRNVGSQFFFVSRVDDVIKSRGYKIGPAEVEAAVMSHPSVQKVAAVQIPLHKDDGVSPFETGHKVYVLLAPSAMLTKQLPIEIQEHVVKRGKHFKPHEVEFLTQEQWEKYETHSGKIQRRLLREHCERQFIPSFIQSLKNASGSISEVADKGELGFDVHFKPSTTPVNRKKIEDNIQDMVTNILPCIHGQLEISFLTNSVNANKDDGSHSPRV
jgi:acetyl-CoA synthetase